MVLSMSSFVSMISIGSVAVLGSAAGIGTEVGTGPDMGTGTEVGAGRVLVFVFEVLGWDELTVCGLGNKLKLDAGEMTADTVGDKAVENMVAVAVDRTLGELQVITVVTSVLESEEDNDVVVARDGEGSE